MPVSDPFRYRAFGLTILSDIALPELVAAPADRGPDVTIRLVTALPSASPGLKPLRGGAAVDRRNFELVVAGVGHVRVADGSEILVCPAADADPGTIRTTLLGSGLGALLLQNARVALHASSAVLGERAVAFLGESGAGKSTLALALHQRGHPVFGDDLCAPELTVADRPAISPGVSRLRLWRESLAAAGQPTAALEEVWAGYDKLLLPAAALAADRAVPLAAIFVLDWSEDEIVTTPLGRAAAIEALIVNSFRGILIEPMGIAQAHMERCAGIARAVPVLRLSRPRDFSRMAAVCEAVEAAIG